MSAKQNKFCAFGPYSCFMPRMYFINIILILYLRDSKSGTTHALPHAAPLPPSHRSELLRTNLTNAFISFHTLIFDRCIGKGQKFIEVCC